MKKPQAIFLTILLTLFIGLYIVGFYLSQNAQSALLTATPSASPPASGFLPFTARDSSLATPGGGGTVTPTETQMPVTTTLTATSTPSLTPTDGPSPTSTSTPSPTNTPIVCAVRFVEELYAGQKTVPITGEVGTAVTIIDLTTGETLVAAVTIPGPIEGYFCEGYLLVTLSEEVDLIENHVILVESNDGSFDVEIVQPAVVTPTVTPTPTDTPEPTNTPTIPYIVVVPNCGAAPEVQFSVYGYNWENDEPVVVRWNGILMMIVSEGHGGSFVFEFQRNDAEDQTVNEIEAESPSATATAEFFVPCPAETATPTPTETPLSADLIISPPTLVATPPIIAYQPLTFTVLITNTGMSDIEDLFFVDLFFDVPPEAVEPHGISLDYSGAYRGVSQILAGETKVITITSAAGFSGTETDRTVYDMVDSVLQIEEHDETNNVGGFIEVLITPAPTPTPSGTPEVGGEISGIVRTLYGSWVPQGRADIYLVLVEPEAVSGGRETLVNQTRSSLNTGFYQFLNVPPPPTADDYYLVVACFTVGDEVRVGERPHVIPTDQFANLYLFPQTTGCPTYRR